MIKIEKKLSFNNNILIIGWYQTDIGRQMPILTMPLEDGSLRKFSFAKYKRNDLKVENKDTNGFIALLKGDASYKLSNRVMISEENTHEIDNSEIVEVKNVNEFLNYLVWLAGENEEEFKKLTIEILADIYFLIMQLYKRSVSPNLIKLNSIQKENKKFVYAINFNGDLGLLSAQLSCIRPAQTIYLGCVNMEDKNKVSLIKIISKINGQFLNLTKGEVLNSIEFKTELEEIIYVPKDNLPHPDVINKLIKDKTSSVIKSKSINNVKNLMRSEVNEKIGILYLRGETLKKFLLICPFILSERNFSDLFIKSDLATKLNLKYESGLIYSTTEPMGHVFGLVKTTDEKINHLEKISLIKGIVL